MKALLTIALLTTSIQSFASEYFPCNYKNGMVVSRTTGNRVSRTFNPKVIAGMMRLEVALKNDEVSIVSMMGNTVNVRGGKRCYAQEVREGFDCFTARDFFLNRDLFVHIATDGSKRMSLVQDLSVPGGAYQQDDYSCMR